ncbi:MAG: hypothetical protein KF866_00730 [Phycisphaeraceae bacterium]|nr:hypothetical protein [Phycisphaeraceae bacterium]MCW5755132.1 hypothetical protein [Phycisphaeraceae bacterium]
MLLHPDPVEGPGASRIAREDVDRFFDGEMSREEREKFFKAMLKDAATAREVVATRQALSSLDEPVFAPDLSGAVLSRVHRRRGFLSRPQRRLVTAGRVTGALSLLAVIGLATVVQREHPEVVLPMRPTPLTSVVEHGQSDLTQAWRNVANAAETLAYVVEPSRRRANVGEIGLADMRVSVHPALSWDVSFEGSLEHGSGGGAVFRVVSLTFDSQPLEIPAIGVSRVRLTNTSGAVWAPAPVDPLLRFGEDAGIPQWRLPGNVIVQSEEPARRP